MSKVTSLKHYFDHWKESKPREWQQANSYENEIDERIEELDAVLRNNGKMFEFNKKKDRSVIYFLTKIYAVRLENWILKNETEEERPFSVLQSWMKQIFEVLQYLHSKGVYLSADDLHACKFFIVNENNKSALKLNIGLKNIWPQTEETRTHSQIVMDIIRAAFPIAAKLLISLTGEDQTHANLKKNFLNCILKATSFEEILNHDLLKDIDNDIPESFFNSEVFVKKNPALSAEYQQLNENCTQSANESLSDEAKRNLKKFQDVDRMNLNPYTIEGIAEEHDTVVKFIARKKTDGCMYKMIRQSQQLEKIHELYSVVNKAHNLVHPGINHIETFVENLMNEYIEVHDKIIKIQIRIWMLEEIIFKIFPLENENVSKVIEKMKNLDVNLKVRASRFESDFVVEKPLGDGGFAEVFKARSRNDNGYYAVKRIEVKNSEQLERARKEAAILHELDHPGIIRYFYSWEETVKNKNENQRDFVYFYIVLQLCHDKTLDGWILENKTIESRPLECMKNWIKQLASALCYLHENKYVHRDVKPANIFFALDNEESSTNRTLKLGDHGLTKKILQSGDQMTYAGTPIYMAPEQSLKKYDEKVDIFSLGLVATELLISFQNLDSETVFEKLRSGNQECFSAESEATKEFLTKMTKKNPEDRLTADEAFNHSFLSTC